MDNLETAEQLRSAAQIINKLKRIYSRYLMEMKKYVKECTGSSALASNDCFRNWFDMALTSVQCLRSELEKKMELYNHSSKHFFDIAFKGKKGRRPVKEFKIPEEPLSLD
ncbi:MAG: hypothetical protein OQK82_03975 [Candidatus Pacearchaeota archaeon]|nr:hypothetical protein [Candidatus Pacearchaeota archaeon]